MLTIKDLAHAEEMDRTALETVRGGFTFLIINGTVQTPSLRQAISDYKENGLPEVNREEPSYLYIWGG